MHTKVFSGGAEQTSGKAKQWGRNKRQAQTALALAVSLWIANGGVAWAAEVNVTNEQEIIISDDHRSDDYIFTQDGVKFTVNNGLVKTIDGANTSGNTITIKNGYAVGQKNKGGNKIAVNGGIANNKVNINIESNNKIPPDGNIYGGIADYSSTNACNNEVKVNGGTHREIYGGYALHGQANGNRVELSGGSALFVYGGAGSSATNNTVVLHDATIASYVYGGYHLGSGSGDIKTGNTLILSGVNSVTGAKLKNFETIKFDTSKLTWDTSKTVLTSDYGYADCDKLDVSGIQALTNITPGTMKLLAIGTGQPNPEYITFNPPTTLVYTGTSGTTTATLDSTNPTVTIQSTAKTAGTGGVTIGYNNTHSVVRDDTNKAINYVVANNVNNITLGTIAWNAGGTVFDGTGYDFTNVTNINATNLKFTNPENVTKNDTMTLLSSAAGLATGDSIAHTQTFNKTINGATLSATLSGNVTRATAGQIGYTATGTALNGINLTGWNGTTGSVPTGWTSNLGANSITATNFAPNVAAGTTTNILTATTDNFFAENQIAEAIKYKAQAASTDTANGVALTGSESKGVKTADNGTKLVYERSNFHVNNIAFGTMAWGTARDASAAGYDYSNAAVNMDGLTFSNPESIAANTSTTLLTANNTLGEIAETAKNISYGYSPVDGVVVSGMVSGSYMTDSNAIKYTATANNATKLTFGNVAWQDSGALMTRPANITFAGAAVDTSNINFTNIKELEAHKTMTLVADFGDSVGTITGTKYKVGSTLQGEGQASLTADGDLIFTTDTRAEKMGLQEQTHNTVMGATVGMAALSAGNDFVGAAAEGLAAAGNTGSDGVAVYGNMGGSSLTQETGSHVNTHTWNAILAFGHKNAQKLTTTEYGAFVEHGRGNYSTINGDERGDGSTHYTGGGFLGKWQKTDGFYVEGSLRAGRIHDDADNVLRDAAGNPYSYETDATYWGAHIGVGQEIKLTPTGTLDVYARYFYNHRGSVSFDAGGHYDLDAVNSSILRLGTRYTVKQNDNCKFYGGIAVEHEFDGKAAGRADGLEIRGADTSGTSVRGELGVTIKPAASPVTLDLNLSGFAGKKRGITAGLTALFHF